MPSCIGTVMRITHTLLIIAKTPLCKDATIPHRQKLFQYGW